MADFPALVPVPYDQTLGEFPVSDTASLNGQISSVRHGNAEVGRAISLVFSPISEADFLLIKDHYRVQRSTVDPFAFTTTTLPAAATPAGQRWSYTGPPEVEDLHVDAFSVRCSFVCRPRGLAIIEGVRFASRAGTLTPGAFDDGLTPFSGGVALASVAGTLTPARFVAGTLWAPTNLSALELFLNLTDYSTLSIVSTDHVKHADDQSANSRRAEQNTTALQPRTATGSTGIACMRTTAAQFLALASSLSNIRYLMVVAEFTEPSTQLQFLIGAAAAYDFHPPVNPSTPAELMLDASNSAAAVRNGSAWMTGQRTAPLELLRRRQPTAYEFSTTGNVTIGQFSADRSNTYGDRGIIGNQYFVIACSSIPTDAERWKLQGWVVHRLLVSGDLPYGHPYRQTIPLI